VYSNGAVKINAPLNELQYKHLLLSNQIERIRMVLDRESEVGIKNKVEISHISRSHDIKTIWNEVVTIPSTNDLLNARIVQNELASFENFVSISS